VRERERERQWERKREREAVGEKDVHFYGLPNPETLNPKP